MNEKTITSRRLTIKDNAGRLESFEDVTLETVYILDYKFYKITHRGGEILYNPINIVFIEMK